MVDQEVVKDLEIFTEQIMKDEGISDYDLHIQGQTEKGTNYMSEIVFFTVTPKNMEKKYSLVMKTAKRAENLRQVSANGVADIREMFMYSKVFPALRKMLEEFKCPFRLENISKTYLVSMKYWHETVIMDNLKYLGYRLWDRKIPMDMEHIKTVMVNYGKFHAASIALRHLKPEIFQDLSKWLDSVWESYVDNKISNDLFKHYALEAFEILKEVGLTDIPEKLEGVPETAMKIFAKKIDEEDKVVITHGDCWINNMMFKYQDQESIEPSGVCFLDFQLSSLRSPATDLSYFLYSACDGPTLANEFGNLLKLYYQSLSLTLRQLDVDPEKVLSFDRLKEHWRKYAIEGLLMATMVIKVELSDKDETVDYSDFGKEGVDHTKFLMKDIKDEAEFKKRIIAVYTHYAETCL